ncbi:MAG: hypothetical protein A2Z18_01040 [Armatimonadetes bacterium RBG_16_58_9]|nr:MAG: hypothetical protein A2Z18_01040 [Armatimonadetes bacterium RBG_16_58_9]
MTKSVRLVVWLAIAMLPCSCAVHASQSLTLSLESPELGAKPPAAKAESKTTAQNRNTARIGRVGKVKVSTAFIYKSKSAGSAKYCTIKSGTCLAVIHEEGAWYGVLMSTGATGWIPAKNVEMTGYDLVKTKSGDKRGNLTSRGGDPERDLTGGSEIVRTALGYSQVRYVYGGTNPASGMDCSAFVRSVFGRHGVSLPRTSREQAQVGREVPFDQLQPGDRLYFACRNPYIDHSGVYAGNGLFVHCSSSRGGVGVDTLANNFFWRSLVTARRS